MERLRSAQADHPHARGENQFPSRPLECANGPSPRAWGKHYIDRLHTGQVRTIPTRVGKTKPRVRQNIAPTDHPHARGENGLPVAQSAREAGPSPRAWGKHLPGAVVVAETRTIPTRVGKTEPVLLVSSMEADHPHARGENTSQLVTAEKVNGPSPRAWGKHSSDDGLLLGCRTIPTRVGKTPSSGLSSTMSADHPHARGENKSGARTAKPTDGPSPRAWGKLRRRATARMLDRTIPTRVGKTQSNLTSENIQSDHPHARGEN